MRNTGTQECGDGIKCWTLEPGCLGCRLSGGSGGNISAVEVLNLLLVPVQSDNYGDAGTQRAENKLQGTAIMMCTLNL